MNPRTLKPNGFTLLEALIVLAIVSLLAAIVLPVFSRTKGAAKDTVSINHLHQLGIALGMNVDDREGRLPSAERMPSHPVDPANPLPRICDLLSPYVGDTSFRIFRCPLDNVGYYLTEGSSYEWNATFNGVLMHSPFLEHFSLAPEKVPLMYEYENFHSGGANGTKVVLFADGHVSKL